MTRRVALRTPLQPWHTRLPRAVSGECCRKRCSPWPAPFSPQAPPKIALLGSSGSSIVWCGPEPARLPCGFAPSQTGLLPLRAEALQRSPGSRAGCFSACAGSKTTQDRWLARDYREPSWCLPLTRNEVGILVLRFSKLNTRPTDAPVYASGHISRCLLQDSRSRWIRYFLSCRALASPSWVEDWRDTPKVQPIRCSRFPLGVPH